MFMTEGIVEEVSGTGFDIMLGLDWSENPIWHAIYGGYGCVYRALLPVSSVHRR